jgi:Family of unknown function (DUF6459)
VTVVPLPRVPLASVQGTLALDLQPHLEPPAPRGEPLGQDEAQVELWARRFAQAAVEIVGGDRPVSQLLRWTSSAVYQDLHRRALLVARAGGHQPGVARVQPVRPQVRSVHTRFVTPTAAEASIHVRYGERSRAVAARFEQRKGRWLCTALDFA